jgi:hypothetical protein
MGLTQEPFGAQQLAELLMREVFDTEDAAGFLELTPNAVAYAAYRRRIPYVQYGSKKLFTRADLRDYASMRGRGRDSRLTEQPHFVVK